VSRVPAIARSASGASILSSTVAVEAALEGSVPVGDLLGVVAGGAAVTFATWWIYFSALGRHGLTRNRRAAFVWGYGHYLLFAAVAAAGAGVLVQLDVLLEHDPSVDAAVAAVAVPAALSLLAVAWLQVAANRRVRAAVPLLVGALVLVGIALAGGALGGVGVAGVMVLLVHAATAWSVRADRAEPARPAPGRGPPSCDGGPSSYPRHRDPGLPQGGFAGADSRHVGLRRKFTT